MRPPAVGFLAWLQLNAGVLDASARFLYYTAIAFFAIVAVQLPAFAKLPFALSFWALSFPVAALTLATMRYADLANSTGHDVLAVVFLGILTVILVGLIVRTALAIARNQICQPD